MSVFRRGKSWYISIYMGSGANRKRIKRKIDGNRKRALEVEAELRSQIRDDKLGIKHTVSDMRFKDAGIAYVNHVCDTLSGRSHELAYVDYVKHVAPVFSEYYLDEINDDLLLRFQSKQKMAGYSNRTVNIHMGLIRKIMKYAKAKNLTVNADLHFPMLQETQKVHAFLTPDEKDLLLKNFTHQTTYVRVIVTYLTGFRPGEAAYLAWDDVDFEMKTIRIASKPEVSWRIKTGQQRTIPMSPNVISILTDLYKNRKGPWVFSETDKPVKSIRRAINTARVRAGIKKRVTPNMLRHSFCSHLLMKGADLKSLMQLMGHTSIATTQRYLHSVDKQLRKTVDLLGDSSPESLSSPTNKKGLPSKTR